MAGKVRPAHGNNNALDDQNTCGLILLEHRPPKEADTMGNGQQRYISNNEAIEIIGVKLWNELRVKLDRQGRAIDAEFFINILRSRFERIVRSLKF